MAEGSQDDHDQVTIPTLIISDQELSTMYNDIVQSNPPIKVGRYGRHRLGGKLLPTPVPAGHEPKAILPISGSEIHLQSTTKTSDKKYYISAEKPTRKVLFGVRVSQKRNGKTRIELGRDETKLVLESLRMVQLILVGTNQRKDGEDYHPVLQDVFEICKHLEEIFDGHKDRKITELGKSYYNLKNFLDTRFSKMINTISQSLTGGELPTDQIKLDLGMDCARMYFMYDDTPSSYDLEKYLGQPPDYDTTGPLQDAIKNLVREFLWNSTVSAIKHEASSVTTAVNYPFPDPRIPDLLITPDPYEQSITLCQAIIESNRREGKNDEDLTNIQTILNKPLNLDKIINHKPQDIYSKLNKILLDGDHKEIILQEIQSSLPNMVPKQDVNEDKQLVKIFVDTQLLRRSLKTIHSRIEAEQTELGHLETRKESSVYAHQLRPKLTKIQTEYSTVRNMTFDQVEAAQIKATSIQASLEVFRKDRDKKSSGISKEESVLWIGLGQGGGQILRECIMYCLDNMTDSRAMSLLYALGIRERHQEISLLLERLYSQDKESPGIQIDNGDNTSPGDELAKIFSEDLHILAMNLGDEVLDLARQEVNPKSYFIWGQPSELESEFEVERHKKNTLKLDRKQIGAGGATGIGRAFGFAREKQVRRVIRDVAGKGGREPKHIVITHSLAGGSGSGMVLPVLEYVRNEFGPEAMIWVMSVGAGHAERKESDIYNTTFIMSDILQSHYNGIHMPVNPIDYIEWGRVRDDFESIWNGLQEANDELLNKLGLDNLNSTGSNFLRNRLAIERHLKNLTNPSNTFCPLHRDGVSMTGDETMIGFIDPAKMPEINYNLDEGETFAIEELLQFLPDGEIPSKAFESWCWHKTRTGNRPALDFWLLLNESLQDPLAYAFQGDKKRKKSIARQESNSVDEFVPTLTADDLANVLKAVEISLKNDWIAKKNQERTDQTQPLKSVTLDGLNGLKDLIVQSIMTNNENRDKENWWSPMFEDFRNTITKYSSHLSSYNSLRVNYVNRIRTFSGAGKDDRIRNIVVSNAHLERGVDQSNIATSGKTYTVYNSVLFDMMMNIIGTRIDVPIHSSGESSSAEKFDDQDLIQNTVPPLVVGLVEMNDSKTMAESPRVRPLVDRKLFPIIEDLESVIVGIFTEERITHNLGNPLGFIRKDSWSPRIIDFISSYFGTRIVSILQHNPYEVMNQRSLSQSALMDFSEQLIEEWESDSIIFGMPKEARLHLLHLTGITSYHIANFYKWISVIDCDLLGIFLDLYSIDENTLARSQNHNEGKFELWKESFAPTKNPEEFDGNFIFRSNALSTYRALGNDFHADKLADALLKLGVWNDDVLRSLSPAYLNTYLPIALLSLLDDENRLLDLMKTSHVPKYTNTFNHVHKTINQALKELNSVQEGKEQIEVIEKKLSSVNLELRIGVEIIMKGETVDGFSTLRITPQLTRYLSAVRDVPSPYEEKLLPVKSPSANLARYLLPDKGRTKVEHSLPIFTKAVDSMKYLRYNALLPDEDKLNMGALLRILLLTNSDYNNVKARLENHCKVQGMNLDTYVNEITTLLEGSEHVYTKDMISNAESSQSVCDQATVLRRRIISSMDLASKLIENTPSGWSREIHAINYWKEFVNHLYGQDMDSEGPLENYNQVSLKLDLIRCQNFISKNLWNKTVKLNDLEKLPVLNIQRLIYDISTHLGEALLQSEYMGSSDLTSRVHFNMTGFSDELIGRPSGVLTLVHSSDSSKEQGDTETDAVRNSIEDCIGYVENCKEFFFQAPFGPRCSVTVTMQQAPSAEISNRYTKLINTLSSNTTDKYKYNDVAKLHPYAFLYNVLWMSANVHRWTHSSNLEYIRKFIIPSDVIQYHFGSVSKVLESVDAANSHFTNISVDFPSVDVALFDNVLSENPKPHRNITDLIGVMAIRHMESNQPESLTKEWESAGITEAQFKEMYAKFRPDAVDKFDSNFLEYEKEDNDNEKGALEKLGLGLTFSSKTTSNTGDSNDFYDVKNRCIAWFKAYKAWEDARDKPKTQSNLSDGMSGETLGE